jgi:hypothetical protein
VLLCDCGEAVLCAVLGVADTPWELPVVTRTAPRAPDTAWQVTVVQLRLKDESQRGNLDKFISYYGGKQRVRFARRMWF